MKTGSASRKNVFGGRQPRQGKNRRHVVVGLGNSLAKMSDSIAQRRQLGAIGQHDRLGKPLIPGHDATPKQNRDSTQWWVASFRAQKSPGAAPPIVRRETNLNGSMISA